MRGVFFIVLFLWLSTVCNFCTGQSKHGNIWYFDNYAGIDFNVSPPKALTNSTLSTLEGCATICDNNGNLLFYTDGISIYTKNHALMNNGSGLKGDPSSTQSGIIVPNPTKTNIYYIFSTSDKPSEGLYYSVVDISLNGGLGSVTTKNSPLMATIPTYTWIFSKSCYHSERENFTLLACCFCQRVLRMLSLYPKNSRLLVFCSRTCPVSLRLSFSLARP